MAIAFVSNRGTATGNVTTGTNSTFTFSPNATCAAGDLVVIGIALSFQVTDRTVTTVTDNSGGGNSWQVDQQNNLSTDGVAIVSCVLAGAITSSTVITVTVSGNFGTGNTLKWLVDLEEYSGVVTSNWFDVGAVGSGSGTALTSGTTGSAASGDLGLAYWAMTVLAASFTPGAGYTAFTEVSQTLQALLGEYQLNVSGAQSATGTSGTTGPFAGAQVTYKAAASNPSTPRFARPRLRRAFRRKYRAIQTRTVGLLLSSVKPPVPIQPRIRARLRRPLPRHRRWPQTRSVQLLLASVKPFVPKPPRLRHPRQPLRRRRPEQHHAIGLLLPLPPVPFIPSKARAKLRRPFRRKYRTVSVKTPGGLLSSVQPSGTPEAHRHARRPQRLRHKRVTPIPVSLALRNVALQTPPPGVVEATRHRHPWPRKHRRVTPLPITLNIRIIPPVPPVGTVEANRHRRRPLLLVNRRHHVARVVAAQGGSAQPTLPLLGVGP